MNSLNLRRVALLRRAVLGVFLAALFGCAEQQIRDQSQADMAAGHYEAAVQQLQIALREYPESASLRTALLQAQLRANSEAISEAAVLQARGDFDGAQARLQRARALDPADERLRALMDELVTQRRLAELVAQAQQLAGKGHTEAALQSIEEGLKFDPRNITLLSLRRRLEGDQRVARLSSARLALAETRPVSLDFRDANLRTVLDVVSRSSGINFVIDRDVKPDIRVTVFLHDAKVEDALDLITSTNQLSKKVVDAQTVLIYPNTPEKQRDYQEQMVRVFYLASADAKGAASFLKSLLKIRDPYVDDRSNMLALRESQENIELAERLISLYDSADPEVLLEMQVLEISSTRLTELGIDFPSSFTLTPLVPDGAVNGLTLGSVKSINKNTLALGIGGLTVNLRREVGDFSTLANPRIRVKNKEKAKVLVGDKIPIVTTTTATGGFVSDSVNYLDVGLKLDVEPTVYPDDDVSIRIGLEVSTLGTATKTASGTLAYQIGTRNANTVLRLHDGQTQLLAGLISKDESSSANRFPGLGDLPIVGRLFSSQLDDNKRTELVLAITPHIVRNARALDASESELWIGTESAPRLRSGEVSAAASGPALPASAAIRATVMSGDVTAQDAPIAVPKGPHLELKGPQDAATGDDVAIEISLTSAVAVRGLPMEILYDTQHLQFVDAQEGPFFHQGDTPTSVSRSDTPAGNLRIGVLRKPGTGAVGRDDVFTLHFKAKAPGDARVTVTGATAIGVDGPAPDVQMPAAQVVRIH